MTYREFKKVKTGDTCVIIQTGEPGKVVEVNRATSQIKLFAKRVAVGMTKDWFYYNQLGKL